MAIGGSFRGRRRGGGRGSALIVVLWTVGLMALMVASFAFDAQIEARLTSYYRKRTKADYLARSGLDVAEMLMRKSGSVKGKQEPDDPDDRWFTDARRLSQGLGLRGLRETLGDGYIELDIVPEPARRNVNKLGEQDWERLLEVSGVPEDYWPGLIDAFYDWTDADDLPRMQTGAETDDYYATLPRPYRAKNGPLDTVGELLLVKDFSRAILFGGALDPLDESEDPIVVSGIADMLTVYGDGKLNVNAASRRVLMTLPEVDELVASAIIEEREGWQDSQGAQEDTSFTSVNDLYGRIPGLTPGMQGLLTTDSQISRVTSRGVVQGVEKEVWCIVSYAGGRLKILRWREQD